MYAYRRNIYSERTVIASYCQLYSGSNGVWWCRLDLVNIAMLIIRSFRCNWWRSIGMQLLFHAIKPSYISCVCVSYFTIPAVIPDWNVRLSTFRQRPGAQNASAMRSFDSVWIVSDHYLWLGDARETWWAFGLWLDECWIRRKELTSSLRYLRQVLLPVSGVVNYVLDNLPQC